MRWIAHGSSRTRSLRPSCRRRNAPQSSSSPFRVKAAMATINVLEREGLRNAEVVGRHIMDRIKGWVQSHPMVGDVRGVGLMIGLELIKDKKTKAQAIEERDRIVELAFERGILFLG